jgi:hypothetical protein
MINFLKKIFIYNWNNFSKINFDIYLKKKIILKKKFSKQINILIVKPFNYSDLYSSNKKTKLDTIKSTRYRMGPISILLEFNTKVIISEYLNENRIKLKDLVGSSRYNYFKNQFNNKIDFKKFNFSKFDWVISIKDSVPSFIIKKYQDVLWTLLFEDHREYNYLRYKIFGSTKYDLTLDTTQGFTPYDLFQNNKSINFPYTFANSLVPKKLGFKNKKKKQILLEIYQPNTLPFKNLKNFKILKSEGNLEIYDHFKRLSQSKYFYCPIYKIPRWGNSIIEAATFNCLIIGNPNCFWNSLLIQKECIAKTHAEGLRIINVFEKNNKLYKRVLSKQRYIFNLINYNLPLNQISEIVKNEFPNKKIFNLF